MMHRESLVLVFTLSLVISYLVYDLVGSPELVHTLDVLVLVDWVIRLIEVVMASQDHLL